MKFDLPSFLLGSGVGASAMLLRKRLRPVLLELATIFYRFVESAPNLARNMPTRFSSRA